MFSNNNGNNGMYMPVAPAYGAGYGGGDGFFGGSGLWALIFLIAILNGGWGGMGGFGWGGMMGMGMMDGLGLYPWLNNSQNINNGFRDQQITTQLGAIQQGQTSGFGDVQLGIAGINQNICQTGNGIVSTLNANQMALLQQLFGVQSAQQQCCCENRAAVADLKYTVATEACNDRAAGTANTTALMTAIRDGIQSIKDDLCADRLDAERRENQNLRTQLNMATLAASQNAQTATIQAGQRALANEVESYVRPQINPAYIVPNPYACYYGSGNNGCGGNAFGIAG